jgi:hypothetical protein
LHYKSGKVSVEYFEVPVDKQEFDSVYLDDLGAWMITQYVKNSI